VGQSLDIDRLIDLGVRYLHAAYREEDGLYPFKIVHKEGTLQKVGISVRYSAISAIGLYRATAHGIPLNFDANRIVALLVDRLPQITNIGDLGLICWAVAIGNSDDGEQILTAIEHYGEFNVRKGTRNYASMELQWLLIGLCYLYPQCSSKARIELLITRCHEKLMRNYHPESGLFSFCSSDDKLTFRQGLKKNLSYFAEQIYGIYSLACHYELSGDGRSLSQARRIAETLCAFQGSEGQWCWTYDIETGALVEAYPVYSVHQHGMAPMALLKLSAVKGGEYISQVSRGIGWIFGKNELGACMVDWEKAVVWRSIRKGGWLKRVSNINKMLCILGLGRPMPPRQAPASGLEIDYECRPYEIGWMIYAMFEYRRRLRETGDYN